MPITATVEERLAKLEREVANLQQTSSLKASSGESWVDEYAGSMKDYPEWGEIVRLGREIAEGRETPI